MEDEENRLVVLGTSLLFDVLLVLVEQLGVQLDVAGLVHTVHVTEASRNGEVRADRGESLVDFVDILGLCVEGVVIDILIIDAVFLAAGDTNLHLKPLLQWSSPLEILGRSLDVIFNTLLRQIDHVGAEERLAVLLEVCLIGV